VISLVSFASSPESTSFISPVPARTGTGGGRLGALVVNTERDGPLIFGGRGATGGGTGGATAGADD
jgi:hypothetical protein